MMRWIVLPCTPPTRPIEKGWGEYYDDAVVVEAKTPEEACAQAARVIENESGDLDGAYLDTLFPIAFLPGSALAFNSEPAYTASEEYPCCGGMHLDGGHSGLCPSREKPPKCGETYNPGPATALQHCDLPEGHEGSHSWVKVQCDATFSPRPGAALVHCCKPDGHDGDHRSGGGGAWENDALQHTLGSAWEE